MEYRHEVINFGESVPVKCFIHQLGHSPRHWHNSIEILLVLSGSVQIAVGGNLYTLNEDDMILVNSNEPHELRAENCILAAIQVKLSLFDDKLVHSANLFFDCNSLTQPNDRGILRIKRLIAQFVKNYASNDEGRLFRAKSLSYALISELLAGFKVERSDAEQSQTRYHYERITRIVDYINGHYSENITLQTLSDHEHLSIPYLSKFFVRMMGVNFTAYLNQLRLTHAVNDLVFTSQTIEMVAERNGFSNTHAFVQLFKKKYGMLPSQYRRQEHPEDSPQAAHASFNDYTILDTHQYLNHFAAYLRDEAAPEDEEPSAPVLASHYTISAGRPGKPLRHTWRGFTAVGSAKELLFKDVQDMLTCLQRDVGFEYIKFHGILSDDMRVLSIGKDGRAHYSFVYVDKVLDFLLSIGLKPLIQLSFMPEALAADPGHRIFDSKMLNSPPRRTEDWCSLVQALVRHLLARYGAARVRTWLFTIWNEPDTPQNMFGFPTDEAFFEFYLATFRAIREIDPALRIGSPSTYFDPMETGQWLRRFTAWCKGHDCLPGFVLVHYYGTNLTHATVVERGQELPTERLQLTTDENMPKKSFDMILSYVRSAYPKGTKVYLTEWNFTPSHRDPLGDTCFRSCYLVKTILENFDRMDSMGYWLLTDLFEEHQVPMEVFHGGLGLFTYNGIKKPAYYAFYLLSKLGGELVDSGDGYFLTRSGNAYQLMLYHYRHYSALYAAGESFDMTDTDRYTPFEPEQKRDFEIRITDVPEGVWQVSEYALGRQSGSSFDKWVEMGAQPLQAAEEVELLKSLSLPMINKYSATATERGLTINAMLDLLEVRLICMQAEWGGNVSTIV